MSDEKVYPEKKGKYDRYPCEIRGKPFYVLVERDEKGNVKQIIEKPNFKGMEKGMLISGMHLIIDYPNRNHCDYYQNGEKIRMSKVEYSPYWVSGMNWGI